jgi:hypothetical protein
MSQFDSATLPADSLLLAVDGRRLWDELRSEGSRCSLASGESSVGLSVSWSHDSSGSNTDLQIQIQ